MIPNYLPVHKELKKIGNSDSHDYGVSVFGHIEERRPSGRLIMNWVSCRESFQLIENEKLMEGFCYTHLEKKSYDSACFITRIEDMLGIQRSVYQLTEFDHVTWIFSPSPWWFTSRIRKSFYSLMIRCSYCYNHKLDNFEDALFSVTYAQKTKTAVDKFLKGYTVYDYVPVNGYDGWFNQFTIHENPHSYEVARYRENIQNIKKMSPGNELIARKAYEIWMENGCQNGYDVDHWIKAEKLLREES